MPDALQSLPAPKIIDEFDAETIFQRMLATYLTTYKQATGKDFSALTESNVVVRLLRSAAEEEARMRQQQNERYKARFVYFAKDENLVALLKEEGLEAVDGETPARRRLRIILSRTGSSAAGPEEWYKRKAIEVAPDDIEAISVDYPDRSKVRVAILAKTVDGIPDNSLVERVRAVLTSPEVHPDDQTEIAVIGAEPVSIYQHARIVLEPETDPAVFAGLEHHYRKGFAERRALGRDMPPSWSSSRLQVPGVYSVEILSDDPPAIQPYQVATLAGLQLDLADARIW